MLKTKYEYNFYSFYDHTGMEQHFEKMAAQGWLIEKLGYFWRYRRIGPQALRFSVVYYSEASEFDPTKPSEGELTFYDFCAQAGWNKAASRAQMNVFYNEDANAVPIETDAALQVETLHQSMKKEQLIAWFLMLALALWIFFDMRKGFIRDFAAALSCLSALSAILDSVLLFLLCALELGGYYLWRRRAKREAELGRFLPTRSHPVLQMLALLALVMGCAVVLYSDKEERGSFPKLKIPHQSHADFCSTDTAGGLDNKKRRYAPRGGVAYRLFLWGFPKGATPPFGTQLCEAKCSVLYALSALP